MPFNESLMDETYSPERWPEPDYAGVGEVARAWLPAGETVGWLIIQDNKALVFFSKIGADNPAAYGTRIIVEDALRATLAAGMTAREAWDEIQKLALWRAPELLPLPTLLDDIRSLWE